VHDWAELCIVVRLTLHSNLTEQSHFCLLNQRIDIQQTPKTGRWQWGRAGCDRSGRRIAKWAKKARNGGRQGDIKFGMALGATDGHENGRGRARQYAIIKEPPGASLTTPANSIHEAMNRRAVRRSAERPSVITTRCEYSTAAAGIRLCDWLWAFVFSESLLRRVL
jgi:hypothetical protein